MISRIQDNHWSQFLAMLIGHFPAKEASLQRHDHETNWADILKLPKDSFVYVDRGVTDYR